MTPARGDEQPLASPLGRPLRRGPFLIGLFGGLGLLCAYGIWMGLGQIRSVLVLIVIALFIAVGLNPLVEVFVRRGMKRSLAVALVFVIIVVAFGLLGWAIIPAMVDQVTALFTNAPSWLSQLRRNKTLNDLDQKYHWVSKITEKVTSGDVVERVFGGLLGFAGLVANLLFSVLTVFVLTLYFLASLPKIKSYLYRLAPASRRPRVTQLGDQILAGVGGYVGGQFLVALCSATCLFIFLMIIGVREYAVALAVLVGCTTFVPMVGGFIGIALVSVIGLTFGTWTGVGCLIYGICYQQFENYVVSPRIMRRAVHIPGLVTVIAALVGGTLLGVVGALTAIPLAAAFLLLVRELWVRRADAM